MKSHFTRDVGKGRKIRSCSDISLGIFLWEINIICRISWVWTECCAKPSLLSLSKTWETNSKQSFKMQFYDQAKVEVWKMYQCRHIYLLEYCCSGWW